MTDIEQEERAIYGIITLASLPVVVGFAIQQTSFDGGGAVSLLLLVAGVLGLVTGLRAMTRQRLPRAIVRGTHRSR